MTTVIPETDALTEWGVRYTTHTAGRHVDAKPSEGAARSWLSCLRFCGNDDAVLVAKVAGDPTAAWIPVGGAP